MAQMEGITTFGQVRREVYEEVDAVIIGSGAGGAVMANELAAAGKSVVVIEEGGYFTPDEFTQDAWQAMNMLYRDKGQRAMIGKSIIPTMQAACIGGSTVINSGICFRVPGKVLEDWTRDHGLVGISEESLAPSFDRVERIINVKPIDEEALGKNNTLFRDACKAMGIKSSVILKNEVGCKGCSACMFGCPAGAKQSMDISYVPLSIKHGARYYANCLAEEIITKKGEALGVKGHFIDPDDKKPKYGFEVRAKVTIVAAGAIGSPVILQKNKLANSSGMVGKNLLNHPGVGMLGLFEEEVNAWHGANQGYESEEYFGEGILLETFWAPPEALAVRFPAFGLEHKSYMARFKNAAGWGMMIKATSRGRVKAKKGWSPSISYSINEHDNAMIKKGSRKLIELFFAGGAYAVLPGIVGLPKEFTDPEQARLIEESSITCQHYNAIGNHPMGTCKMGEDKKRYVVDSNCETFDVKRLYVCDGSIFPDAPGVNPQLTIMALADHTARKIANDL